MEWLDYTQHTVSPNYDDRPLGVDIDMLVIHNISLPPNCYENTYVEQFFQNELDASEHPYFQEISDMRVSSHLYIKRDGLIIQFVPLGKRAWHAGQSSWKGRQACNDFSIGIELQGCDEEAFTDNQYTSLAMLTKDLRRIFPNISRDNIVGHSDISPGRKTDPGRYFDWERFFSDINVDTD